MVEVSEARVSQPKPGVRHGLHTPSRGPSQGLDLILPVFCCGLAAETIDYLFPEDARPSLIAASSSVNISADGGLPSTAIAFLLSSYLVGLASSLFPGEVNPAN